MTSLCLDRALRTRRVWQEGRPWLGGLLLPWLLVAGQHAVHGDDWPQWGGPQRDHVWRETGLINQLPAGPLPRRWSVPVASGYAGPAVADGRVFLADRVATENLERVLCFSAADGTALWEHAYPAPYSISYPLGPRCTPTVDGPRVYALGAVGHLWCLEAATGKVLWQKHLPTEYGTRLPAWGTAAAPLVDREQLIVLVGGSDQALVVSFDKTTGRELWRALDDPEIGYAPPVILEFGGRRQLIVWHPAAITSLDPRDGSVLWKQSFEVSSGLCIATPRKIGNRLFVTSFYNGPLMIDLGPDGLTPNILWKTASNSNEIKNNSLHAIMCTPLVNADWVAGVGSYGELRGLDSQTGEILWETFEATGPDRWWNAFLIPVGSMSGERVFICNEQGELLDARISRTGFELLGRAQLIEPTEPVKRRLTVWSHPAFAQQSIFARNDRELIRVDLGRATP